MNAYAVILAGGTGERFWPLSREVEPKHCLKLYGRRSLLQETFARVASVFPKQNIYVVTVRHQKNLILRQLPSLKPSQLLVEPFKRNTALAISWAAVRIFRKDPRSLMSVFPADHLIQDTARFRSILRKALKTAAFTEKLVLLGIRPTYPATIFGYLKTVQQNKGSSWAKVASFIEKPPLRKARKIYRHQNIFWNSGIFTWKTSVFLDELERWQPELWKGIRAIEFTKGSGRGIAREYSKQKSLSIDKALLERSDQLVCLPASMGWNDLGSWHALGEIYRRDGQKNVQWGKVESYDVKNCTLIGTGPYLVTAVGVEDLVVVSTHKSILVVRKDKCDQIPRLINLLKKKKQTAYL